MTVQVDRRRLFGEFLLTIQQISRSARERGEMGEGNDPIWSLEEWARFIDDGENYAETGGLFAEGVATTIRRVRTMINDGKDARFIHRALFWIARQAESDAAKEREKERQKEQAIARRDRENLIKIEKERELIRLEARERAKAEFAGREGGSSRRRPVESGL